LKSRQSLKRNNLILSNHIQTSIKQVVKKL